MSRNWVRRSGFPVHLLTLSPRLRLVDSPHGGTVRGLRDTTYTSGDFGRPRHQDDDEGRRSFGQDGRMNDRAIRAAMPIDKVMEKARRYTSNVGALDAWTGRRTVGPILREGEVRNPLVPVPWRAGPQLLSRIRLRQRRGVRRVGAVSRSVSFNQNQITRLDPIRRQTAPHQRIHSE